MTLTTSETLRAWILSALVVHGAVAGNPDAKRLYDDLLSNYNKLVRPVVNTSDVLKVCIKLKLSQLIDVVSKIALQLPLAFSAIYILHVDAVVCSYTHQQSRRILYISALVTSTAYKNFQTRWTS